MTRKERALQIGILEEIIPQTCPLRYGICTIEKSPCGTMEYEKALDERMRSEELRARFCYKCWGMEYEPDPEKETRPFYIDPRELNRELKGELIRRSLEKTGKLPGPGLVILYPPSSVEPERSEKEHEQEESQHD